jgi:riboflavin synthase
MFSGIVEGMGTVKELRNQRGGKRMTMAAPWKAGGLGKSESVCVSGACLTAVAVSGNTFAVEMVPETLRRTTLGGLAKGSPVNLERSIEVSDRLGGHVVTGHVDGVATIRVVKPEGQGVRMTIEPPGDLMKHIVEKGSVCVEGVSLTVAGAGARAFDVALIPYTLKHTTLGRLKAGSRANIETDILAKYVEKLVKEEQARLFVKHALPEDWYA